MCIYIFACINIYCLIFACISDYTDKIKCSAHHRNQEILSLNNCLPFI